MHPGALCGASNNRPLDGPLNRSDMGLLSIFKRNASAPAAKPVADTADAVQRLRLRARRRLMGAAVLVGIGVIGFPLVFETQPRPIPMNLPIEIPRKDNAAALPMPVAPKDLVNEATGKPGVAAESGARQDAPKIAELAATAPAAVTAPAPTKVVPQMLAKSVEKAAMPIADKASEKRGKSGDDARAQALLDGKAPNAAGNKQPVAEIRYVVQVGAFADAGAAHQIRLKVEKLGLKTYAQVISNAEGKRTRVRVGPFATREEADKVFARIRASGLPAAVLTL